MATYISLVHFTQQGVQTIKDAPSRLDAAKQAMQAMGVELKSIRYTMGQYDAVAILDAPDDEAVSRMALAIGARSNVRAETFRAYTEQEFGSIVAGLP